MLENFFQFGPIPINTMTGSYDPRLVILSYLVATFASYIALDIAGRLRDISNTQLSITLWLCGGALAMGAGIWSMHFIGMLAFKLPMSMGYQLDWTALSMIVAIAASGFALYLLKPKVISIRQMALGGVILGLAIAAMHYTGMQAMKINMDIHYLPGLFFLSILIAIVASEAALWLAIKSTQVIPQVRFRLKFVSAFVMGAAICGMHYTGMAAAVFTERCDMLPFDGALNPELMAIIIAAVTFVILGIAFVVSSYKDSINQQLLLTARQAGMAEVAASVLHNVGNVLNSVGVSSSLLAEKIQHSKLDEMTDLSNLIEENKDNFDVFIKEDSRGKHIPEFIRHLSNYWRSEQALLNKEISNLIKNVDHIKNIIATQQDFSRSSGFEQVVSIESTLEEAILISGIEYTKTITVKRDYASLKPVMVDKVKLLLVLVNLIQNAKDSLLAHDDVGKTISFKVTSNSQYIYMSVSDNGVGIPRENFIKIFAYGFTTKKSGHGFGLHSSAISAKEMGGELKVESDGVDKGATFTLVIPNKIV